jgi:hypothetical protein
MERDYDVILADILISIDQIESKIEKSDKRMDLTIRRLVKIESRLEKAEIDNKSLRDHIEGFTKEQSDVNLEINKKLSDIVSKLS